MTALCFLLLAVALATPTFAVPLWPVGSVLNPLNNGGSLPEANNQPATGARNGTAPLQIRAQGGMVRTQESRSDEDDYQLDGSHVTACRTSADCGDETIFFCDEHYAQCDRRRKLYEQCRRDAHCEIGTVCLSGKCLPAIIPGRKGSRCGTDGDCRPNFCCARQHGEKICKPKLRLYESCYVPKGGLDYSLNESCGCVQNSVCSDVSTARDPAHRDLVSQGPAIRDNLFGTWVNINNLRCLPLHS